MIFTVQRLSGGKPTLLKAAHSTKHSAYFTIYTSKGPPTINKDTVLIKNNFHMVIAPSNQPDLM